MTRYYAAPIILALCMLLSACGGGSTGSAGSQEAGTAQPSANRVLYLAPGSSLTVDVAADTSSSSGAGPAPQEQLILTAQPSQWYWEVQWQGTATTGASMQWTTQGDGSFLGTVTINTQAAAHMGAGTYPGTVTVSVCSDNQCANQVPGSPLVFTVQYAVTGTVIPDTTFSFNPNPLDVEASSDDSATTTAKLTVTSQGLPTYGAYIFPSAPPSIVSSAVATGTTTPGEAVVDFSLIPGSQLSPGPHTGTAQISVCFDYACAKPANGSPFAVPISYDITAVAGRDFNQQIISPIPLTDIALDPASQQIVELARAPSPSSDSQISLLDPGTGKITASQTIAVAINDLIYGTLAISDDGQFAYVGLAGTTPGVERVNLDSMTADLFIPISGTIQTIKVAPGQPHTIAVEASQVLTIYDDATARSQTYPMGPFAGAYTFCWGQDATTIFSYAWDTQSFLQLSVGAGGLTLSSATPGIDLRDGTFAPLDLQYGNGVAYSDSGRTYDTSTHSVGAAFGLQSPTSLTSTRYIRFAIDSANGKAYFLQDTNPSSAGDNSALQAFGLSNQSFLWMSRLPGMQASRLLRWGTDGLAFIETDAISGKYSLLLLSGSLLGP